MSLWPLFFGPPCSKDLTVPATCLDGAEGAVNVELPITDRLEGDHGQPDVLKVLDGARQLRQHSLHERVDLRQHGLVADVHVATDERPPRLHLHAQAQLQRRCVFNRVTNQIKINYTSLCSASCVSRQRDTARRRC